ncbi:hypothetical protein TsFJ059_009905 [Trichoderma semiorbis]|uniref:Uncharacterized protein n=1 Tax=Trichoderma semiorbis TaxID=1491008 RepID=A0A9P8HJV5_9HYPO|nr:hypothetical protein TsFJ059_009905 [Trichoderma semiorbis]
MKFELCTALLCTAAVVMPLCQDRALQWTWPPGAPIAAAKALSSSSALATADWCQVARNRRVARRANPGAEPSTRLY